MVRIKLQNGGYTTVDEIDGWAKNYKWYKSTHGYVVGYDGKFLHRLITDAKDELEVDHINRDKLDNRRENLRLCTRLQNNRNRSKFKNNKTGYKGVYKKRSKYQSTIRIEGKTYYLGTFNTIEEAHAVYTEKARQVHGEYYYENNLENH